jgi:BirA family biotin operon repressor/biotin-[acetyl-CoA-carboxylase] ligase
VVDLASVTYDGVASADLAARLATPGLRYLAEVPSVLDELHRMAATGSPAGAAVLADRQTRGRGRLGRTWHSPAGAGIWLAFLIRPGAPETGLLALRVGLAVVGTLESLGAVPRLKWPNDVLLDDRKVCGVLCEARWERGAPRWVAAGIGINVHGPLPAGLEATATTLTEVVRASRLEVLERLLPRLQGLADGAVLSPREHDALARCDWLRGRRLRMPAAGVAAGIDPQGALLVEAPDRTARVTGGTIVLA